MLPEGNLFGTPVGVANFVADGYQDLLSPLSPGEHAVVISNPNVSVTHHLIIAEPEVIDAVASPQESLVA